MSTKGYRYSYVANVKRMGGQAMVIFDCKHFYTYSPRQGTVEHLVERLREDVGKRQRCALCEKADREVKP